MTDYTPPLYDHALDADELQRNLLWKRQLRQRYAFRAFLQSKLAGDPIRRLMLTDKVQPLIDGALDRSLPPLPPDPEMVPPANQNLNAS